MQAIDVISRLNKILKPISDLIIFLFTTKIGILILIIALILYLYVVIYNRVKDRKLIYEAATDETKLPWSDFWLIVGDEISRFIGKIFANISIILVVLFIMLAIVGLSNTFTSVSNYVSNQKKINELSITLKNLNKRYKVARVEVLNYDLRYDSTTLKINFYDYAKNGLVPKDQIVKLHGHNIYFQTYVMNFGYTLIENGSRINIAIPYLIYSEKMTQEQGIKLQFSDSNGIPYIFKRDSSELFGIEEDTYNKRMKEIVKLMYDDVAARKAGVRSKYDSSPHYVKALNKGQIFYIWVEQTGGLVIKQEEQW